MITTFKAIDLVANSPVAKESVTDQDIGTWISQVMHYMDAWDISSIPIRYGLTLKVGEYNIWSEESLYQLFFVDENDRIYLTLNARDSDKTSYEYQLEWILGDGIDPRWLESLTDWVKYHTIMKRFMDETDDLYYFYYTDRHVLSAEADIYG